MSDPELLRDDRDGLRVLCAQAAAWFTDRRGTAVRALILEKDFWVTEVLRALSTSQLVDAPNRDTYPVEVRAVLKGGTSLSKAFDLIQRFSEDVDVFLRIGPQPGSLPAASAKGLRPPPFAIGASRVDHIMEVVAQGVATALGLAATRVGPSTTGVKRAYRFAYPVDEPAAMPGAGLLKAGVQLELVRLGHATPTTEPTLRSMLHDFVTYTGAVAVDDFVELQPFHIAVLGAERTLVDKLCIVHRLADSWQRGNRAELAGRVRHFYDIARLLESPSVLDSLDAQPGMVAQYAAEAETDSVAARRRSAPRPAGGFATSPAFCDELFLEMARLEYERELGVLRLGPVPDFGAVVQVVRLHADRL